MTMPLVDRYKSYQTQRTQCFAGMSVDDLVDAVAAFWPRASLDGGDREPVNVQRSAMPCNQMRDPEEATIILEGPRISQELLSELRRRSRSPETAPDELFKLVDHVNRSIDGSGPFLPRDIRSWAVKNPSASKCAWLSYLIASATDSVIDDWVLNTQTYRKCEATGEEMSVEVTRKYVLSDVLIARLTEDADTSDQHLFELVTYWTQATMHYEELIQRAKGGDEEKPNKVNLFDLERGHDSPHQKAYFKEVKNRYHPVDDFLDRRDASLMEIIAHPNVADRTLNEIAKFVDENLYRAIARHRKAGRRTMSRLVNKAAKYEEFVDVLVAIASHKKAKRLGANEREILQGLRDTRVTRALLENEGYNAKYPEWFTSEGD